MTLQLLDLLLYAVALFVLFATPGPVWVAVIARALSGGVGAAVPLTLGVVVGDVVWAFVAILGVSWIVAAYAGVMTVLRIVAVVMFLGLGLQLIRKADHPITRDSRLTRPGLWAGFLAGLAVIFGNPKAILFYMGVLPGFFDLRGLTVADMIAIALLSAAVPLAGNLVLALGVDRMRRLIATQRAMARLNRISGALLIAVGVAVALN